MGPRPYYVIIEREARNGIKEYVVEQEFLVPAAWYLRLFGAKPDIYRQKLYKRPEPAPEGEMATLLDMQPLAKFGNRQAAEEFIEETSKFDVIKEVTARYPNV
jgi:hypothetical protein